MSSGARAIEEIEGYRKVRPYLGLLRLLWAIREEHDGATYDGINVALGYSLGTPGSYTHGKRLSRGAAALGWVRVQRSGHGRGKKAVVSLTALGVDVCRSLFGGDA